MQCHKKVHEQSIFTNPIACIDSGPSQAAFGGSGGGGVSNFRRLCTKQQMENAMNSPQLTPDEKVHSNELN
jgi:hypothetical protein